MHMVFDGTMALELCLEVHLRYAFNESILFQCLYLNFFSILIFFKPCSFV